MPFSPDYVRLVLNENFEDAKTLFLSPLMSIHYAHLAMLAETGIVSREDAAAIRRALDGIDLEVVRAAVYDGSCEDLFFYVERLIGEACGPELAGRLHTARSRNDIDMTMYRMALRGFILNLVDAVLALRRSLLEVAAGHLDTVFPAHTHTQPAQVSTVAHYLLAVVEERERDTTRLFAGFASTNRNPLGACAITGTGFPIDRDLTSALLGFDGPTGNTYGSIATVDYLLESAAAAAVTLVGVGRFVQDMLLWCTSEVGYLRLDDSLVQTSSIMPQKRNPVALEHGRALLSKAFGQVSALPTAVHNTPFGDIVDTEDDLQPLVASAFRDAARGVSLVAAAMAGAAFNAGRMRERATQGFVTITELADTLARDHGLSFRAGHTVAAQVVRARQADPKAPLSGIVRAITAQVAGREIAFGEDELERLLTPEHFVAVRRTLGGPAADVADAALGAARSRLAADLARLTETRASLAAAEQALRST